MTERIIGSGYAKAGGRGYFTRYYCDYGHAHRTEAAALRDNAKLARRLKREREERQDR